MKVVVSKSIVMSLSLSVVSGAGADQGLLWVSESGGRGAGVAQRLFEVVSVDVGVKGFASDWRVLVGVGVKGFASGRSRLR